MLRTTYKHNKILVTQSRLKTIVRMVTVTIITHNRVGTAVLVRRLGLGAFKYSSLQ
jgi:hypothetical protein